MYKVDLIESWFPAVTDGSLDEVTVGGLLERMAQKHPDKIALKELDFEGAIGRTWTYPALLAESQRLASALAARHEKGARIAVWAPNCPEWVLLEFAAGLAGLTLVTVNPSYQARELKYVLKQSRAEAIYLVDNFRGNPMKKIADEVCSEIPAIQHRILLEDSAAMYDGEGASLPDVTPQDIAQIQYTSGTTGFPKGALLHHHGLVQNAIDSAGRIETDENAVILHNMPLFHTTGCAVVLLGGIGVGGTLLLAPIFDPVMIAKVIEREKVTHFMGVPTMIVAIIEVVKKLGTDTSSLQAVFSGGAMVSPELCREAKDVLGHYIQIVYGQTESSPCITGCWGSDSLEDLTTTIGQPMPNVDVSIRDPQTNEVLPIGQQGEICARGYLVMHGYNDNPEATAKTIDKDGWLHTGDLGRMDARGYIKITGRVKEMIIRGGENIFPVEIENAMAEHPALAEIAVVGVPDRKWGEQVACFMRAAGDSKPAPDELKAFVRERLSPQKTPVYWVWVDEWPLTGSGKIQKFKLAEQFEQGQLKDTAL